MPSINGQKILITGASSGIGAELAKQLGARGCQLALLARRQDLLEELAADVEKRGGKAHIYVCDVADKEAVHSCFTKADDELGGLDIVVLNAGVGKPTPANDNFSSDTFEWIFKINVFGVLYGIEAILPRFRKRGHGVIVPVSSLAAYRGLPGSTAYGGSKAAVTNMMEGMRVELADQNIQVVLVSPGFVKTPMTDKNKFDMPFLIPVEKACRKIIRGIEKRSREVQFPFPLFAILSMAKMIPNFLWDRMTGAAAPKSKNSSKTDSSTPSP